MAQSIYVAIVNACLAKGYTTNHDHVVIDSVYKNMMRSGWEEILEMRISGKTRSVSLEESHPLVIEARQKVAQFTSLG